MDVSKAGSYKIVVENDVLVVQLDGFVNAKLVREFAKEVDKRLELQEPNKKSCLLVDIDGMTGLNKQTRVAGKEFLENTKAKKIAIWTKQRLLGNIATYIIRLSKKGDGKQIVFFRNRQPAIDWLVNDNVSTSETSNHLILLILALLIISSLTVLSPQSTTNFLGEADRDAATISVLTIFSFGLLYLGFLAMELSWLNKLRKITTIVFGTVGILAVTNLLLKVSNSSTQLENLTGNNDAIMSQATSFAILLVAILAVAKLLSLSGKFWRRVTFLAYLLLVAHILLALFIIAVLNNQTPTFSYISGLSLTTTLHLFACLYILTILHYERLGFEKFQHFNKGHVAGAFIIISLMTLTGLSTHDSHREQVSRAQSNLDETSVIVATSIEQRVDEYVTAIKGFKALYAASDEVNAEEFNTFYESRTRNSKFPAISNMSFIARVPRDQAEDYVKTFNADELYAEDDVNIETIFPDQGQPVFYSVTFIAPYTQDSEVFGLDLSTTTRRSNLLKAELAGEPSASEPLNLNDILQPEEQRSGFFITVPVYSKRQDPSTDKPLGFVNAIFDHSTLFAEIDTGNDPLAFTISDSENQFFNNNENLNAPEIISSRRQLNIADRTWDIELQGSPTYGILPQDQESSAAIIVSGLLFSIIAGGLFVSIANSRQRAQKLAALITEDLELEREQAKSQAQRLNSIMNSIGDGVFAINARKEIILFNPAAENISGYSQREAVGKPYDKVLDFAYEDRGKPNIDFVNVALGGKQSKMGNHTVLRQKNGAVVPVEDSAAPITNSSGQVVGVIVVFRDASEERELEQAKDDFLGLASHQLRTPATAVKQYIGLLLDGYTGKLTQEQTEALQAAHDSNERQLNIVQDMLSVARLESGKMQPNHDDIDLKDILMESLGEQSLVIEERSQKVEQDISSTKLKGDQKLLRMVAENLLSNASKYTKQGGTIGVSLKTEAGSIILQVKDSGVGIAQEDIPSLFKRFSRVKNELSDVVGGSGLGLHIAQKIAVLHNGKITVQSQIGKGTTFTLTLPVNNSKK